MAKCTFCGKTIEQGTGKIFVEKEGKVLNFCTLKCEKNMLKLRRKPITTKWSTKYIKPQAQKSE
jgi:large subunit ribosomal protein L24e